MNDAAAVVQRWMENRTPELRDRVIEEHRYLCRRAARRFVRPGIDRADLEQVAAIGLIKAADRYDAAAKTPFEAYAWVLVLGELMHYVRDSERLLRAPRRIRDLERRWVAAERDLWALLGREPRDADVATFLNATPAQAREIRDYRASSVVGSFDLLRGCEIQTANFDNVLDKIVVERALSTLTPLERRIVHYIDVDGYSVVEAARRLGYSRRHLTRLHRNALSRLRASGH